MAGARLGVERILVEVMVDMGISLEGPEGKAFLTRSRVFTDAECQELFGSTEASFTARGTSAD